MALVPGLVVMGLGMGFGVTPLIGTVLSGVRPEQVGAVEGGALALVSVLPRAPGVSENVLLERLPGRVVGLVYSLYFLTGGRVGDQALSALLQHTIEHRTVRAQEAPRAPGEFLVHHYVRAREEDRAWLRYLLEEALARGAGPVPHEAERLRVMAPQVDEIRSRQAEGLIDEEFDPAALRLLAFALALYPLLLPQGCPLGNWRRSGLGRVRRALATTAASGRRSARPQRA